MELNLDQQLEVLAHKDEISKLIKNFNVNLVDFYKRISKKNRLMLYENAEEMSLLLEKLPVDFDLFVLLSAQPPLSTKCQISWAFFRGINREDVWFEMLRVILEKKEMLVWIEQQQIDLALLLNLPVELLKIISSNLDKISQYVPEYISAEAFLKLEPKLLEQLLKYPESDQSQKFLAEIQASSMTQYQCN